MRAINENTLAVLKSQSMLGQDKFNYDLKLEGYEAGYSDIKDSYIKAFRTGGIYGDFCIRADGKVLATYRVDNKIMLSVVDTEDDLLGTDNAVLANEWEFTTIITVLDNIRSSVLLRLNNGKIILFVYEQGNTTTANHYIKIYISNNGLGTDFAGTEQVISEMNTIGANLSIYNGGLGKPMQLPSGRVILPAIIPYLTYGYYFKQSCIFYSDNLATWTLKAIRAAMNYTGDRLQGLARFENGKLSVLIPTIDGSGELYVHESADDGTTWSELGILKTGLEGQYSALFTGIDNYNYMLWQDYNGAASLYRRLNSDIPVDLAYFDYANWEFVRLLGNQLNQGALVVFTPRGTIGIVGVFGAVYSSIYGFTREIYSAAFPDASISISKGRGGANSLSITADNAEGKLNPNNPTGSLYGIINLNKQIIVKMGYGEDLIETFTGLIDEFSMKSYPHIVDISCRDHLKKALDQTITEGSQQTVAFTNTAIESIFGYLCYLAGIETGTIEATGINISKVFSWQSYADAFQFLADLASFEYGADEYGKVYFRRDYQPNNMAIAYTFEEGVDITSMSYKLSDDDLYYRVKAYGKSGDTVLVYDAPFVDAAKYNILPQKILKVDATEASTVSELRTIAERALYLMNSRTAVVEFEAIAVPWLQVGDFIQVYERSSMSTGIYRISSMTLNMTPKRFTMRLSCYYYGDSIVIGELPTETATQTADPNLNLIPEMTSNTAPSGVARASSIYNGTYEPWQALNSTDADYYWNSIAATGWIEYQFTELTIVDKYMLKARQALEYNDAMPKNFTFEAFDGSAWVVLDTRTNQTAWGINEQRQYLFANTTAYIKYRLNVSANNGYSRLQLEQLAMYYGGGS